MKFLQILKMIIMFPINIFTKRSAFSLYRNCKIDRKSAVLCFSRLLNVSMAKYSYIGRSNLIINAKIGAFCSISDNCCVGLRSHPTNWVSSSSIFIKGKNILRKNFSQFIYDQNATTIIGNDVWIGMNAKIKQGIVIGDGAIIGANAVVTKNVPPFAIVGGVPAKIIRFRFEKNVIDKLLCIKWWELNDKEIALISDKFQNPNDLIATYNKEKNELH